MKTIDMKRMAAMVIAFCMAAALSACVPSEEEVSPSPDASLSTDNSSVPVTPDAVSPDLENSYISKEPSQSEVEWHFDGETGVLSFDGVGSLSEIETETGDDINYGWTSVSDEVTEIIIGEGITRIPSYSFYDFNKAESVSLPSTLTSIGTMAFFQCAFEEIIFPTAVEHIGRGAFSHCKQLRTCDIQEKVTVLEPFVFEECVMLENITFQEGLTELKEGCLMCCDKINVLIIPSSVTNLEELYAGGVQIMVFRGNPPALPKDPVTGEYWLGYGSLTVYYPENNKKWKELIAFCREDIIWIEGLPSDGA